MAMWRSTAFDSCGVDAVHPSHVSPVLLAPAAARRACTRCPSRMRPGLLVPGSMSAHAAIVCTKGRLTAANRDRDVRP